MNAGQRRKLFAGVGLISMLVGALMIVAPVGAGAEAGGGNEDCPENTTLVAKFNYQGGGYVEEVEEGEPGPVTILPGANAEGGSWTSTVAISVVIVKGSTDAKFDQVGGAFEGSFDSSGLQTPSGNEPGISNVKFCAGDTPPPPGPGSLTVSKVAGTNPPNPSPVFTFTVDCGDGVELDPEDAEFNLDFGESRTIDELPDGTTCDVEETATGGAQSTTVRVNGGSATNATLASDVAIEEDETSTVEFTNNYPGVTVITTPTTAPPTTTTQPPAPEQSLRLIKQVTGDAPEEWNVTFDVVGGDLDESATVNNVLATEGFADIDAATYTVVERDVTDGDRSTLVDVSCVDDDGGVPVTLAEDDSVTVEVAEGSDVVCTFTNNYTEVLDTEVTVPPTTEPEPEAVTPPPAVQGDVVSRTLPRTGNESRDLAAFGAGLLFLGAGLVLASRSRYARIG